LHQFRAWLGGVSGMHLHVMRRVQNSFSDSCWIGFNLNGIQHEKTAYPIVPVDELGGFRQRPGW
jgi:hypothetical protein